MLGNGLTPGPGENPEAIVGCAVATGWEEGLDRFLVGVTWLGAREGRGLLSGLGDVVGASSDNIVLGNGYTPGPGKKPEAIVGCPVAIGWWDGDLKVFGAWVEGDVFAPVGSEVAPFSGDLVPGNGFSPGPGKYPEPIVGLAVLIRVGTWLTKLGARVGDPIITRVGPDVGSLVRREVALEGGAVFRTVGFDVFGSPGVVVEDMVGCVVLSSVGNGVGVPGDTVPGMTGRAVGLCVGA